jgi:hypothetical protein
VRWALAALHKDTNNEASLALAAQATICNDIKFDKGSEVGSNWHAKQGNHKDDTSRATKQEAYRTADQGGGMRGPQVLTADEETDVGTNLQANKGGNPSEQVGWAAKRNADHKSTAQTAAQRKANHVAHRGGGRRSPQVLTALSGTTAGTQRGTIQRGSAANFFLVPGKAGDPQVLTALYGTTAGTQGKTVQRGSTANFFRASGNAKDPQVLTALYGTTAGTQGGTGQRGSTANFFLAPGKARDPHVLPALFGPTTGIQGETGQGGSAADFFRAPRATTHGGRGRYDPQDVGPAGAAARMGPPAAAMGTPYEKEAAIAQGSQEPFDGESEVDSGAKDVPGNAVKAADQEAMRILVDNRSIRGTTA